MMPVEDGWILKTDAPDQITVQAENDSSSAFLVCPADSGELKILEEDAQTIVVCTDADNDGIYEQEIARSTKAVSGDADGDMELPAAPLQFVHYGSHLDGLGACAEDYEYAFHCSSSFRS